MGEKKCKALKEDEKTNEKKFRGVLESSSVKYTQKSNST